jgi:hypothetical protein
MWHACSPGNGEQTLAEFRQHDALVDDTETLLSTKSAVPKPIGRQCSVVNAIKLASGGNALWERLQAATRPARLALDANLRPHRALRVTLAAARHDPGRSLGDKAAARDDALSGLKE